uniref:Uncharacterized protein n=1 Tax=Anguilla anguilla TaxID=7936 RepID=A0A0E9U447_ANGAN
MFENPNNSKFFFF